MIKRLFLIFIYIYIQGCDNPVGVCQNDSFLVISSYLNQDENGYYEMEWLEGYTQPFTTLQAETGLSTKNIYWQSDRQYNVNHMGTDNWTDLVNPISYTDDDGVGNTVLGVWEEFVGDTITVYCNYTCYDCNIDYVDSLKVIIKNEE